MRVFYVFLAIGLLCASVSAKAQVYEDEIIEGVLIIKVKEEFRDFTSQSGLSISRLKPVLEKLEVSEVTQLFPNARKPSEVRSYPGLDTSKMVDISLIYRIEYSAKINPLKASTAIFNTRTVEYAEPKFTAKPAVIPSDARIDSMWHLPVIKAFEAWDIDTGSKDITIAIVDTGVDYDHPDLQSSLWRNLLEIPDNGIDDDDNGYIDDYLGWNFFNENNDMNDSGFAHGTHVAGLAGAATNNEIGVAGTGWGCKIMAVKSGDKLQLPFGYEGIVYAAENGADIINCSWGSFSQSSYGREIVQYATYNHQALVIGAAGNDNRETLFFPASYPEVMSVGATDSLDRKADFSNYNYDIDIVAPGSRIYSLKNEGYGYDSGTSMAAPIVAGAAGLIMSRYPQLSPLQVMEQLRVTADIGVYEVDSNKAYSGKLGTGRLNMHKALLEINSPALKKDYEFVTDLDDNIFQIDETIFIEVELVNYLLPMDDINVELSSLDPNIEVVKGSWEISSLPENGRSNNLNSPFEVRMTYPLERNQLVTLKLVASSPLTDYSMEEYITFNVNQDYVNVMVNNISTTVSQHGLIGYTDYLQSNGLGFQLEREGNFLYESGLMIGHDRLGDIRVADRVRNRVLADQDFWQENIVERHVPQGEEAFLATGSFTDTSAIRDEIGLLINQRVTAFDDEANANYVLIEYTIKNQSGRVLDNLNVGVFADWDIVDPSANRAKTAFGKRLGYIYHTGQNELTAGIQSLSDYPFKSYMIDNIEGGNGGVDMYDEEGYTSIDKYTTLTNHRAEAGNTEDRGNDVIQVASVQEVDLDIGDEETVVFALHAGKSIEELIQSADAAFERFYGHLPGENVDGFMEIRSLWPNPTRDNLQLSFDLSEKSQVFLKVHNATGDRVFEYDSNTLYAGFNLLDIDLPKLRSGFYFIHIHTLDFSESLPFQYLAR